MSCRVDGGSTNAASCLAASARMEASAWPAPPRDGGL